MSHADFPNATPRPWYFDGWDIFTSADSAGPRGDGHRLVVPLSHLNETFHPSQKVSEDDARLIVAAVNERDALVAENQQLRDALKSITAHLKISTYDSNCWGALGDISGIAHAALAGTPSKDTE